MLSFTDSMQINVAQIGPSRWQPRRDFNAGALHELALSIQDQGLINPVLVFGVNGGYELIAGERRTRAVMAAHLSTLFPQRTLNDWCGRIAEIGLAGIGAEERAALAGEGLATIRAAIYPPNDLAALHLLAVTENLDRADLSPIEEAHAYKGLMDAYGWRQRELAERVNKSQSYVAQRLALLALNPQAVAALSTRVLSITEARAIAAVPAPLQDSVTAYAVEARENDDAAVTTRELEKLTRAVTAFVDPNRWQPNPQRVYQPFERNRLRILQHLLDAGGYNPKQVFQLRRFEGYRDLLQDSPATLVGQWAWLQAVCKALGAPKDAREDDLLEQAGMTCETCIKRHFTWSHPAPALCEKPARPDRTTCCHYIGPADPVVLPLADYKQKEAARALGILHEGNGQYYLDNQADLAKLTEHLHAARPVKAAPRHQEQIRRYYDWQMTLPQAWRDDIQAHACEKCLHYAPLYLAQNLPPCCFALNPWEPDRAPYFGALTMQTGQLAPRCEGFRYHHFDLQRIAGKKAFPIPAGTAERLLHWMEELAQPAHTYGFWGPLFYIYRNNPPQERWSWHRLKTWLLDNWNTLASGAAAHILDVIITERHLAGASLKPVELLDLDSETPRTWIAIQFPFDDYAKYGWLDKQWPAGWPKPWKASR